MGKSGRRKKLTRQEKAKTQLKGVKKLAAAANIVNPTLKVKRIVIREQLTGSAPSQQDGEENPVAITKRHQTLTELLSTLHHHNTNLKKDALTGLLELVNQNSSGSILMLKQNLDKILERIAALTSDVEGIVRRENLKVAEAVFERVEESDIQPFWSLVLTHLKCTLTHLNPTVRYSTFPFFHLLIAYFPNLVVSSRSTILSSLLGLITSSDKDTTRLKFEISGKKDEVEERLKVFALINACLRLKTGTEGIGKLDSGHNEIAFSNEDNQKQVAQGGSNDQEMDIVLFSPNSNLNSRPDSNSIKRRSEGLIYTFGYDSIYSSTKEGVNNNSSCNSSSLADILGFGSFSANGVSSYENRDGNQFCPRFIQSCMSCLMETWIEAGPSSTSSSSSALASSNVEPSGGKPRQRDFDILGNKSSGSDRNKKMEYNPIAISESMNGNSTSRKNLQPHASINLNAGSADILKSLVDVMTQLVALNRDQDAELIEKSFEKDFVHDLGERQGADLKKYFFNHLPYVAIQESFKRMLTTVNLQLFLLAAHLRLIDEKIMRKFQILIDELIEGESLDQEQCGLILKFLSCSDPGVAPANYQNEKWRKSRKYSLSTDFFLSVLSSKDHRRDICKFLQRVLRPENINAEEMFLIQSLDWEVVTAKLINCFSRISSKWLNLLTHISIRKLTDVKTHLLKKTQWFQDQLDPSSLPSLWNECLRLFWYADALSEFKEAFANIAPENLKTVIASLEFQA